MENTHNKPNEVVIYSIQGKMLVLLEHIFMYVNNIIENGYKKDPSLRNAQHTGETDSNNVQI